MLTSTLLLHPSVVVDVASFGGGGGSKVSQSASVRTSQVSQAAHEQTHMEQNKENMPSFSKTLHPDGFPYTHLSPSEY